MASPQSCPQQHQLLKAVQQHLIRSAALTCAATEALAQQNQHLLRQLDRQVDREAGENERALGALRQHREEHGC